VKEGRSAFVGRRKAALCTLPLGRFRRRPEPVEIVARGLRKLEEFAQQIFGTRKCDVQIINVRLSAIRHLALEAADNGVMALELAAGITRVKGAKRSGVRLGHWLTAEQAEHFLALPDLTTLKGIRDGAVLAILLGAGRRGSSRPRASS
jgi:hypothetical protein